MIGVSPRQLEVFAAVAELGSVRAAAERLHLTQPAVSMALAQMESRLEARLFDRARRRLHINERGRALLPRVQEALVRLREIDQPRPSDRTALGGALRIGASNTVGNYRIGELLGGFVAKHPRVTIDLAIGNTETILDRLLDFALDVACVEGAVTHPGLQATAWREDRLVVCAGRDHPLARRRRLRASDFAGQQWILREPGSATRSLAERALARLPDARASIELPQTEAIKQAVIAGLGLAFLPAVAVADSVALDRIALLSTPFLDLHRTLWLATGRDRYQSGVLGALLADLAKPGGTGDRPPTRRAIPDRAPGPPAQPIAPRTR